MTTDPNPVLAYAPTCRTDSQWGWVVAAAGGLAIGVPLGVGAVGSYRHSGWAMLAGIVVGMMAGLAVRRRPLLAALGAGVLVVAAAVTVVVTHQYRTGFWPITDEFTIVHYGTERQAVMRATVILLVLVGGPALAGGAAVALGRRCVARLAGSGSPLRLSDDGGLADGRTSGRMRQDG